MTIDRNNYEQYCLDFLEGKLEASLKDEFLCFLSENPDIKNQLEGLESLSSLQPELIEFSDKGHLKKGNKLQLPVTKYNFEEFCTAFIENDISDSQKNEVKKYIENNPGKEKEFELFSKTRFVPDYNIVFNNKKSLKKNYKVSFSVLTIMGIAASLALIFVLSYVFIFQDKKNSIYVNSSKALVHNIVNKADNINSRKNKAFKESSASITTTNINSTKNVSLNKIFSGITNPKHNGSSNTKHDIPDYLVNYNHDSIRGRNPDKKLNDDNYISLTDLNISPLRLSKLTCSIPDCIDNERLLVLISDNKTVNIDNNIYGTFTYFVSAIGNTTINKVKELTGISIKYSSKKVKSRKIISFETPLFGFYKSSSAR